MLLRCFYRKTELVPPWRENRVTSDCVSTSLGVSVVNSAFLADGVGDYSKSHKPAEDVAASTKPEEGFERGE